MRTCEVCSAKVKELRRGRCWGCYSRWVEARPVGLGATCCLCGERRRQLLKSVELLGAWVPVCHSCGALATRLDPLPQSIAEIRATLRRDRRADERRWGKKDTRVFRYDRRQRDRRRGRDTVDAVDDDMILEVGDLDLFGASGEHTELTRISERPATADLGSD